MLLFVGRRLWMLSLCGLLAGPLAAQRKGADLLFANQIEHLPYVHGLGLALTLLATAYLFFGVQAQRVPA